jgi:predicted GNAT superfamily acetyltransferase
MKLPGAVGAESPASTPEIDAATALARDSAKLAGIVVRELSRPDELDAASSLLAQIWGTDDSRPHIDPGFLVALAFSGNYVTGAFVDDTLVATSVGFFHPPLSNALHSHITGVLRAHMGRGVGQALKLHQRAWCLERGVTTMTWTYDPLVARNAYFNLRKLGGHAAEYLPDFYGAMSDKLNQGQPSDRMLLVWPLAGLDFGPRPTTDVPEFAALLRTADGPQLTVDVPDDIRAVRLEIPNDIESLRESDPDAATDWRTALRIAATGLLNDGWQITDFDRRGYYRAERTTS